MSVVVSCFETVSGTHTKGNDFSRSSEDRRMTEVSFFNYYYYDAFVFGLFFLGNCGEGFGGLCFGDKNKEIVLILLLFYF